jgi:hypothetical protein
VTLSKTANGAEGRNGRGEVAAPPTARRSMRARGARSLAPPLVTCGG